jgi:hypothetical protein
MTNQKALTLDEGSSRSANSTRELKEIHEYSRASINLFAKWFIFLVTANYVTVGWLVLKLDRGAVIGVSDWLIIGAFIVTSGNASWFCFVVSAWFRKTGNRAQAIYASLQHLDEPFVPHKAFAWVAAGMEPFSLPSLCSGSLFQYQTWRDRPLERVGRELRRQIKRSILVDLLPQAPQQGTTKA